MAAPTGIDLILSAAAAVVVGEEGAKRRGGPAALAPLASCRHCRRRQLTCPRERPACQRCIRSGLACSYDPQPAETQLRVRKRTFDEHRESSPYEELFGILQTVDANRADEILKKIRYGFDAQTVLTQIRDGDLVGQLNLRPESQFRYQLPHIKKMPRELVTNNPYLDTLLYEPSSLGLSCHEPRLSSSLPRIVYLRPLHAAQFVDHLIDDVRPSLWTSVCDDDALMRRLLRNLFLCEFYFMSAFQKDLFLEDVARRHGEFCSPLLVNAVLAYACVCDPGIPNRAEYWNSKSLTYRFLVEAKRLWEDEGSVPKISSLQAGIILNGISNLSGLDELGQTYRRQCVSLANKMKLYDGPIRVKNNRSRQGAIYTAWALFCWDALLAFSLQQAPFLLRPPYDPLPSWTDHPEWYGRFWLQYPGHAGPVSAHFGAFFQHRAQFRVILAQHCRAAFAEPKPGPLISIEDAYQYRSQLLKWFDSLPGPLKPENIVFPGHLQLHMYYHHLLVTIFESLLSSPTEQEPAPEAIFREAHRNFSTLYRLYYIRHGHYNMDIHIIISLIFAGARCLDALQQQSHSTDKESLRSTLVLCATGLYHQRQNSYLAHALYSMIRARMPPEEVKLLKQFADVKDDEEALSLRQATRSKWLETVIVTKDDLYDGVRNIVERS